MLSLPQLLPCRRTFPSELGTTGKHLLCLSARSRHHTPGRPVPRSLRLSPHHRPLLRHDDRGTTFHLGQIIADHHRRPGHLFLRCFRGAGGSHGGDGRHRRALPLLVSRTLRGVLLSGRKRGCHVDRLILALERLARLRRRVGRSFVAKLVAGTHLQPSPRATRLRGNRTGRRLTAFSPGTRKASNMTRRFSQRRSAGCDISPALYTSLRNAASELDPVVRPPTRTAASVSW